MNAPPRRLRGFAALAAVLLAGGGVAASDPHPAAQDHPPNRLAAEASPYLQLHARNPVDWYPWGDAAFEAARAQDKPIFLSVGYSTCFWCHVMEREVFSDPAIAALMNDHFVSVKVDREERPDIDELYMSATQLMTGSGGWPNSVFLTPAGEPFFAGTYFPPEDSASRPGFPRVLRQLADAWRDRRGEVDALAQRTRARIEAAMRPLPGANESFDAALLLADAVRQLQDSFEPVHGGFSERTKFPSPPKLELLLAAHRAGADPNALGMLTQTLDEMALGGIYDHLAGGFHRYATEPTWTIPHYEKMLYDNAQLLGVYARAYALTGRALYRQVAAQTAQYLEREMRHPEGGFFSAQDAEVDGHEGASYLWTRAQLAAVLGERGTEDFLSVYQLARVPEGAGMALRVRLPDDGTVTAERLAGYRASRDRLLAARNARKQPLRDDKVIAAWNGLAIRGLVDAGLALSQPTYVALAEQAARFVLQRHRREDGRLYRSYVAGQLRENGMLDDYAYMADALLALHRATGDAAWLRDAQGLARILVSDFEDPKAGGFFLTTGAPELFARPRQVYDDVEPAATGVALRVLRELAARSGDAQLAAASERTIQSLGGAFARSPIAVSTAVLALAEPLPAAGEATPPIGAVAVERDAKPGSKPATQAPGPAPPGAARSSRLPRSEDHVHVAARPADAGNGLVVSVTMDPGWHVNANPASLAFLVATSVRVVGRDDAVVRYPAGSPFEPAFSPIALSTYRGTVEIAVELEAGAEPHALEVRYQACDEARCLPPSTSRPVLR